MTAVICSSFRLSSPPAYLTSFGIVLWMAVPVWFWHLNAFSGEGRFGLFWRSGGTLIGVSCDARTYYWPNMRFFPKWRFVFRAPLIKIEWQRVSAAAMKRVAT